MSIVCKAKESTALWKITQANETISLALPAGIFAHASFSCFTALVNGKRNFMRAMLLVLFTSTTPEHLIACTWSAEIWSQSPFFKKDVIDLMVCNSSELQELTDKLTTSVSCGMEIIMEKSWVMVNTHESGRAEICMNSVQLEEVQNFKYLGMTISKNGSCAADMHLRTAAATTAMAWFNKIWDSRCISFSTKFDIP